MKRLVGSEKQVAWAQDIREGYIKKLEILKEAEKVLRNTGMKEVTMTDPLGLSSRTVKRYAVKLTNDQRATISSASNFAPKPSYQSMAPEIDWVEDRKAAYTGNPHAGRLAEADYIAETIASIERAVENEESAKFWIEHR